MAAGALAERYHGREQIAGFILLGCTLVGLATSFGITHVPAADPSKSIKWNPIGDLRVQMKTILADRTLAWAVMGNTYLFFLAALLQFTIIIYGHDVLRINETHISYLQAAVGIGIGIGSVAAGYLSGGKIEYGLIPLGALGMTVFGALLYFQRPAALLEQWFQTTTANIGWPLLEHLSAFTARLVHLRIPDLLLLGFFGGFFAVPLNALIQHRPRPEQKGGVIAAANFWSFVGIFIAAGAYNLFSAKFHQSPAAIFLDGAILTAIMSAYSIYLLPDSLLRLVLWMVTHSVYRIRVEGRENIPEHGGALFVSNHMSLVDALLLLASTDRHHPLPHLQRHLRPPVHQALRQNDRRHPHLLAAPPARHDPFPARSQRRHPQRRSRLHLRRRPDHAHRPTAPFPPRPGTHHEKRRRAHHPG